MIFTKKKLKNYFWGQKKRTNVLKLFLLAFQETPTILYIKTTNEDGGGVFIDDQSRGLSPTDF